LPGRRYISGERSAEDLGPLRAAGCEVRIVPAAGHVLMSDNAWASLAGRRRSRYGKLEQ
jgi:hypothetical protein